jgi:plastocyanin
MRLGWLAVAGTLITGACAGGDAAAESGAAGAVAQTGTVIEVHMQSGIDGERFTPPDVTAQRGDVVRFVLDAGVHNVAFPADQNLAGVKLPDASPYLQVPGQTYDLVVDLPAGTYNYHCEPHAVLGMIGTLTVTD